jgi:hypothetical protein
MARVERGIEMVLHSVIIGLLLYILMVFVLKQKEEVAENRSILISAFLLIYMVLFGHSLPNKINKDL